jgi:hypothetical protein
MAKLTPGERAINWAKALAVLCSALVALLGYTNKEKIASWVSAEPVPNVETVSVPTTDNFQKQTIDSLQGVIDELKKHSAALAAARARLNTLEKEHGLD